MSSMFRTRENIVRNKSLEVVKAFSGDMKESFNEAVKLSSQMYRISVGSRADIVFLSPGGHPFDVNLFEACKSIDAALNVTKKGKVIVMVAECVCGYGNREFYKVMSKFKDLKGVERSLKRHFSVGRLMAYHLMKALEKIKIILVSTMPDYYATGIFGLTTSRAINDALNDALNSAGKNAKVLTVPYAACTFPTLTTRTSEITDKT